ncbi:MAG: aldose 1-epimerase [Arcanobacterium sp.]|nr:aldose 1-epimerase [Arcanobacterium sp.]
MIVNLAAHGATIAVSTRGATLISWDPGVGESVIDGYVSEAEQSDLDGYRCAVLVPWPNRLARGQWQDGDILRRTAQADTPYTSGPDNRGLHGLIVDREFSYECTDDSIEFTTTLPASNIFPADLEIQVRFIITAKRELQFSVRARNLSARAVPVALGWHPYFTITHLDDVWFDVGAAQPVLVDDGLIPLSGAAAFGEQVNGRQRVTPADDYALARLEHDSNRWANALLYTGKRLIQMEARTNTPRQQIFHVFAASQLQRRALQNVALEPCTAMANAFNRPDVLSEIELDPREVRTLEVHLVVREGSAAGVAH